MPVTAAVVGIVTGIGSAVAGGVARGKQKKAAEKQGDDNAKILEGRADQTEKVMGFKLGDFDKNAGRFLGSTDAAISASGVEGTGSTKMSRDESVNNLVSDRENLFDNYAMQASELREQARLQRENGAAAGQIAAWQGVADVSSGISSITNSVNDLGSAKDWW